MTKLAKIQLPELPRLPFRRGLTSTTAAAVEGPLPERYEREVRKALRGGRHVDWQAEVGWADESLMIATSSFEATAETWPDR